MSQSTHQSTDHKRQSQDKNQTHAYAKVGYILCIIG